MGHYYDWLSIFRSLLLFSALRLFDSKEWLIIRAFLPKSTLNTSHMSTDLRIYFVILFIQSRGSFVEQWAPVNLTGNSTKNPRVKMATFIICSPQKLTDTQTDFLRKSCYFGCKPQNTPQKSIELPFSRYSQQMQLIWKKLGLLRIYLVKDRKGSSI